MFLIECQGYWKDGHLMKCDFNHFGKWGDKQLHRHQKVHEDIENGKTIFWCGYERVQGFKRERSQSG